MEKEVEKCIDQDVKTFGIIHVLKKGVSVQNLQLTLFFPRPTAADSETSKEKYAANQFSVTRQQTYSTLNPGNEIDMVIFVNGLPLMTFELKNPWTHQTAAYDGRKQYKEDRSPRDTIFNFGRCLAYFTMDKDEVFFTTKVCGEKTYFMPFNKGLPDGQGKGNPVNPSGHKTSYMWQAVLTRDNIADIISNYTMMDYGEKKTKKKVPHIMKNAKKLVFPRYHQLDVVTRLMEDVESCGVGKRYLIMHSAGSGKSYSLTWLAYKLIKACPRSMEARRAKALDEQLFDSVIVVVDRQNLDEQITDDIRAFAENQKTIAHADTSGDLKTAIVNKKRIIITTIQKFPFICDTIADVSDHNFAVIIDEAHSSQSGIAHDKMNATMQQNNDTDEEIHKSGIRCNNPLAVLQAIDLMVQHIENDNDWISIYAVLVERDYISRTMTTFCTMVNSFFSASLSSNYMSKVLKSHGESIEKWKPFYDDQRRHLDLVSLFRKKLLKMGMA